MAWSIRVDRADSPERNMRLDEELAQAVCSGELPPTVRIYGWVRDAISLGRRQRMGDIPSELRQLDLPVVRRPTGGGAVVHGASDLTYAAALPRPTRGLRELPLKLHQRLFTLLRKDARLSSKRLSLAGERSLPGPVCFDSPVAGDLLYDGRKVAGSALRAWREGILIQGSIQGLPLHPRTLTPILVAAWKRVAP